MNREFAPRLDLSVCCLCGAKIESDYLAKVFAEQPRAYYLAIMVCHYRHEHVNYYDNGVGYVARYHSYDAFKSQVNERAKRQILRKAKQFLIEHGFTPEDFRAMQGTEEKTLVLARKVLCAGRREAGVRGA